MISASVLGKLCPYVPSDAVSRWANALSIAAEGAGIRSKKHFAMWIALVLTSSDRLTHFDERLNLDANALAHRWPELYAETADSPETPSQLARDIANDPQRIASHLYAGVKGNGPAHTGDGWRFRPRYPCRLLGRSVYTAARHALDFPSLVSNPDALLVNFVAMSRVSAWLWYEREVYRQDVDDYRGALKAWSGDEIEDAHDPRALLCRDVMEALDV